MPRVLILHVNLINSLLSYFFVFFPLPGYHKKILRIHDVVLLHSQNCDNDLDRVSKVTRYPNAVTEII